MILTFLTKKISETFKWKAGWFQIWLNEPWKAQNCANLWQIQPNPNCLCDTTSVVMNKLIYIIVLHNQLPFCSIYSFMSFNSEKIIRYHFQWNQMYLCKYMKCMDLHSSCSYYVYYIIYISLNIEKYHENEKNPNLLIMFNTSIGFSSFFHWALDFVWNLWNPIFLGILSDVQKHEENPMIHIFLKVTIHWIWYVKRHSC